MRDQSVDTTPTISPASAGLLAVAVVAGTILAGLIAAQAVTNIRVYVGAAGFLAAIASVAGVGFIVQLAAERVMWRIDHLDERVSAQRVTYLPGSPKPPGVRHLRPAGDAPRVGLDPETIAAARALARRIADGTAEGRRDA